MCERSILKYCSVVELFKKPGIFPLPPIRCLNRAAGFGAWQLNLAFSPRVKVARFRRPAGGGGVAWVALWWAFPQTQELVFWWFLRRYLTSALFSCWYFLLLKQRICAANAIFCCKVNRSLFGDAVYEGWEPVPGTITLGNVLDVHWVKAVCYKMLFVCNIP